MSNIQMNLFGGGDEMPSSPIDILKSQPTPHPMSPVMVSYGGGKNSTAMLILLAAMGVKVDLILFADTGGEMPETYEFIDRFRQWLISHGMPDITFVKAKTRTQTSNGKPVVCAKNNFYFLARCTSIRYYVPTIAYAMLWVSVTTHRSSTLEEQCLSDEMMPSKAYGRSSCSVRWKIEPQNEFVLKWLFDNNLCGVRMKGKSVVVDYPVRKLIGYHAGELSRLIDKSTGTTRDLSEGIYRKEYPLIMRGIDEALCVRIIEGAGLGVPPKSSCFFCPNKKPREIMSMPDDLLMRSILIESCALNGVHRRENAPVKGLGRRFSWSSINELTELELIGLDFRSDSRNCHCLD